jgi:hypothetical protein
MDQVVGGAGIAGSSEAKRLEDGDGGLAIGVGVDFLLVGQG